MSLKRSLLRRQLRDAGWVGAKKERSEDVHTVKRAMQRNENAATDVAIVRAVLHGRKEQ